MVEPRFRITESGYIKSRFLDDKASSGILLAIAKYVSEHKGCLKRNVQIFFTVHEEVGHGAAEVQMIFKIFWLLIWDV